MSSQEESPRRRHHRSIRWHRKGQRPPVRPAGRPRRPAGPRQHRPRGSRPGGPRPRRRRPDDQRRHRRPRGARACRGPRRGRARPYRRVGQRRVHLGVRPLRRHRARGVPSRHRGDLPRLRQRHPHRAEPDAASRQRRDRPGRVRPRPPRDPAPVGLLRRQARHVGLPRVAADRAAPRPQQRPRHLRSDARRQHPAVHLGALQAAQPGTTRSTVLPARGRRPRRPLRRRPPPTTRVLGRRRHRRHHHRQPRRRRPPRPLPRTDRRSPPSRPTTPNRPTSRPTSGSPPTSTATTVPTAPSTTAPARHSPQQWASQHRRVLATAAATAALAGGLRTASQR